MSDPVAALAVSLAAVLVIYGAMLIGRAVVELAVAITNRWLRRDLRKRRRTWRGQ